ncbi:MAG TPA: FAD-dependent oxidoreductase [Bryobacteraceae bacterium]|nr:FAD-dependent oxidoreductase [Bryobacteraceae bacterium]
MFQANYGKTSSVWMAESDVPRYESLSEDLETDVCIVGAGIAGLSTAYQLLQEGVSVVVLEAGLIVRGETSRTTAHLSNVLDDRYYELERLFGREGAALARESHAAAIDTIEQTAAREGIECDFVRLDGYLFVSPDQPLDELDRELNAALRAGLNCGWVDNAPLPGFKTGPCLRFPGQAQFDPLAYLGGLAGAVTRGRGRIFTRTRVANVTGGTRPHVRTLQGNTVRAKAVVVATNTPIHDNLTIHSRQGPYRTYVIGARIPWDAVPRALYWDTQDPYHYVRLRSARTPGQAGGGDVLIAGGEDHKQGEADDGEQRFRWLEEWTRKRFPIEEILYRWSGMVCEPADSLALIGRDNVEQNVYIVTGDSGHGMTHGAIAGILLSDLIRGRKNSWASIYDPCRITARAASEYLSENAGVVSELLEWFTPGELPSEDNIAPGHGAVVRRGLGKVAVYRDVHGQFHERSAACPHLGCIVSWNSTESSWDCPCHGSRFDTEGKVLRGPATRDLEAP